VPREAFARLMREIDGEETAIGQESSAQLWEHLLQKGYLNEDGKILDAYDPNNPHFRLDVPMEHEALRPFIVDELNRYLFKNRVVDARKRKEVTFNKEILLNPDFEALWLRISQRTRYRVEFSTEELIQRAAERIMATPPIIPVRIETTKVLLDQSRAGIEVGEVLEEHENYAPTPVTLPDLLAYLQNETELTRHTLVEIIRRSCRAEDFKINPQQFITVTVKEITKALRELMLGDIKYEKIENDMWDMHLLDEEASQEVKRYLFDPYKVNNLNRTTHDFIDVDSNVERTFAARLDYEPTVKLFMKLPRWFKVDTPIGAYNPDWAILFEEDERVYMIRETKDKLDRDELRNTEREKVDCGEKHFAAIGVDYRVVTNLKEALRRQSVPAAPA
jgi:type III restriction enzyme